MSQWADGQNLGQNQSRPPRQPLSSHPLQTNQRITTDSALHPFVTNLFTDFSASPAATLQISDRALYIFLIRVGRGFGVILVVLCLIARIVGLAAALSASA